MKKLITLILLFTGFYAYSQQPAKDTVIYLNDVVIKKGRETIIKIKTKGEEIGYDFHQQQSIVTLIENIPEGYLKSVTFDFNSGLLNLVKKALNIEYADTEMELLLYKAGPDGKPGAPVLDRTVRFVVKKKHKGNLELDVSSLNIKCEGNLFVGLKMLGKRTEKDPVALKVHMNPKSKSYIKYKQDGPWYPQSQHMVKLRLKIAAQDR